MEEPQWLEVEIPGDYGIVLVDPSPGVALLGAHSVPKSLTIHKTDYAGLGAVVEWNARVDSGRVLVEKLTAFEEFGSMDPNFLSAVSMHIWPDTFSVFSALTGIAYEDLWEAHLDTIEPREGKTKGQWVACLWRNHFEPQGWSMVQLADRLGLTHKSVLTYASRNDPTRKSK